MACAPRRFWLQAILILSLLGPIHGQLNESFHYTEITQAFPLVFTTPLRHSPSTGGQNFTQCCIEAVSQSYSIQNGKIVLNQPNYVLGLTPNEFNTSKFPCGATYDGNADGAPEVVIPYKWCNQNCRGWEKSTDNPLTQWVQPFVGFILPAAVFCLNVPRQSTPLAVSDRLFGNHFKDLPSTWRDLKGGLWAIWDKCLPFRIFIHPYIRRLLSNRKQKLPTKHSSDPTKSFFGDLMDIGKPGFYLLGAFLMMLLKACIAAGVSLVNTVVWVGTVFSLAGPMILSGLVEATVDRKVISKMLAELSNDQAKRLEAPSEDEPVTSPKHPMFDKKIHQLYVILVGNLTLDPGKDIYLENPTVWNDVKSLIDRTVESRIAGPDVDSDDHFKLVTDTRLKAMLDCQSSFGAAVGAPVVFFVGSFLFSVISNFSTLGDNDTSHSLAFGEWWMIIPHVAIVSGCLLAGNNPHTLQVIVSTLKGPWREKPEFRNQAPSRARIGKAYYNSVYTPVWMWERGRSKRRWIAEVTKEYASRPSRETKHEGYYREARINTRDWAVIVAITLVLMIFPFTLAFLTSYFTPAIGMSCRTFTFLLYFLFQLVLSVLWMIDFFSNPRKPGSPPRDWKIRLLFNSLVVFTVLGSIFTAVVGTFLQILGVYRNCLCQIPMNAWHSRNFNLVISSNSADDIKYASKFWVPTGVASIVLMIVTCYLGWWYQRHWRIQFKSVVDKLLTVPIGTVAKAKSTDDDAGGIPDDVNPAADLHEGAVDEKQSKLPVVVAEKELKEDKIKQNGEGKIEEHPEEKIEDHPENKIQQNGEGKIEEHPEDKIEENPEVKE